MKNIFWQISGMKVVGMKFLEHGSTIATYNNECDMLFIQLLKRFGMPLFEQIFSLNIN